MRIGGVFAAAVIVGVLPGAAGAAGLEALDGYSGAELYARFCASCHGARGLGDGTVAPALKVLVPDLTRIAARNGGRFPEDRVREIVDGRAVIPAHGTRFMPVWGYELEAQAEGEGSGRAVAQSLIDRLVDQLRSMQQ